MWTADAQAKRRCELSGVVLKDTLPTSCSMSKMNGCRLSRWALDLSCAHGQAYILLLGASAAGSTLAIQMFSHGISNR